MALSSYERERAKERKEHGGFEKYEVEEWSRCLEKAAEVMGDPKKMAAVSKILAKKEKGIRSIKELRKLSAGKAI